jgi:hypothetical protein
MTSVVDRVDPNLTIERSYRLRVMWIALAAFFGLIGFALYAMGIHDLGGAKFKLPQLSLALDNAGPGLVVMVAALGCAVVGAIRTKVKITPPPEGSVIVTSSSRECKLFSDLCEYLATAPRAFVILDDKGGADIESMGWTEVPGDVQARALEIARGLIQRGKPDPWEGTIENWRVEAKFIGKIEGPLWCLLTVKTQDPEYAVKIVHEDCRLLLLFSW